MNVYFIKNINNEEIIVLHFGIGLIGEAIKNSIFKKFHTNEFKFYKIPFDWLNKEQRDIALITFFINHKKVINGKKRIIIIWSAGNYGFRVTSDEALLQMNNYRDIVKSISKSIPKIDSKFILLSSAGGLFENQVSVDCNSMPKPLRVYGELKLEEENYLLENTYFDNVEILRLSSVYSTSNFNKRMGLIPVLMKNGLKNKVSYIYGNDCTLRDYITDTDISNFITNTIKSNIKNPTINILANGKPSSIFEIKKNIEKILRKKLYIVNSFQKDNSKNISFAKSVIHKNFVSSNLYSNLKLIRISLNK